MHKIYELLGSAEVIWRRTARSLFPLFEDTPVAKGKPDPKSERHWSFSTDGTTTHMDIFLPDKVQSYFENLICDLYEDAYNKNKQNGQTGQNLQNIQKNAGKKEQAERLMHDTLTYLYFHEMLHPAETPDSKSDEEKFDKALYDGIKAAEPHIQDADILRKVANVRNAGWDIVIDNSFFHGTNFNNPIEKRIQKILLETHNKPLANIHTLPDGVVPIFDVIEFAHAKEAAKTEKKKNTFDSLFYPITRLMYGLLFTKDAKLRKKIVPYFKNAMLPQIRENELEEAITNALKGFVKELDLSQLRLSRLEQNEKEKFEQAVDVLYKKYDNEKINEYHELVINTAKKVLGDKRTRYDAMRGFIKPLAKYISLKQPENRPGTHGGGSGGSSGGQSSGNANESGNQSNSGDQNNNQEGNNQGNKPQNGSEQDNSQNILEALLNIAGQLPGQEGNNFLSNIANNPGGKLGAASSGNAQLQILATDEYYKRNAKEINIKSPRKEAVKLDLGKKRTWHKIETHHLLPQDLLNLPIDKILRFQGETGITQLFQLSEHEWQYDIYEERETEEFDYTFQNVGLELPENIVFHVDSSGSMGGSNYVGTKQPYDKLMHIIYGILKPVKSASVEMKKDVQIITANFSNGTIVSKQAAEVKAFYNETINETKKVLLGFQGGGTDYTIKAFSDIEKMLKPGKTVHVFVTDGELYSNNQDGVYNAIVKLTQNPNTSFLYFNLNSSSSFGNRLEQLAKQRRNVQYTPLATLEAIQSSTLEVVMQYED